VVWVFLLEKTGRLAAGRVALPAMLPDE